MSTTYESLDVVVPMKISNQGLNAKNAPILFDIPVGGYLSSAVQSSFRGGGGGSAPPGRRSRAVAQGRERLAFDRQRRSST